MTTTFDAVLARAAALAADDEVVTRALSRDVELPLGAGTMALITLDNGHDHTKPNTFGAARSGLAQRGASTTRSAATTSRRSASPASRSSSRSAPTSPGSRRSPGATRRWPIAQLGHGVMRKLGDGGKPSFCFVNGAALGGGLELALHCDYRTVLDSVTAIALPEVFLGLVPGWGGAFLLPNLIGAEQRGQGHRRERPQPEHDAQRPQGLRARHRGRDVRWRGLPRAVAALGRRGADR